MVRLRPELAHQRNIQCECPIARLILKFWVRKETVGVANSTPAAAKSIPVNLATAFPIPVR